MDTNENFIIELLTLQYIQGKTANTPLEYLEMYRKAKAEIETAYKETDCHKGFDVTPLAN